MYITTLKASKQEDYPTVPSNDTDNNFCASTANSIGNLLSTSLA